jgi:hypothetical protein
MEDTVEGRAGTGRRKPQRCDATEVLLRSGRGAPSEGARSILAGAAGSMGDGDERIDLGLRVIGHQLGTALSALDPYRHGDDELRKAYNSVHAAMGDLAAVYCWITVTRKVRQARPERRRRPWDG